jgi:aspartyl-tRNA(Asn)/glutamyl-tRNA(Gln) amidotransferase subunit A
MMSNAELGFKPAIEVLALIRQRKLSPVEYMRAVLDRIQTLEPKLNAFATLIADQAMDGAKAAEAALMKGEAQGPLFGLSVTIKDLTPTKGIKTERGSHIMKGAVPDFDVPFVERLRNAGAIVLGKTTTSEFGWTGVSRSPLTGITHNPWKQGYNAGASSAGAGVGAAAGYGALHQGSDGAGSVRMPAHFCGVCGLKPTYGRIPNYPISNNDYSSHIGPLTRSVADSALMLSVMAGPHPLDHTSCEAGPADYLGRLREGVRGKRIAFSPDLGHARVDPDVADLVKRAAQVFETDLGAKVETVTPAWGREGPDIIRFLWAAHYTQFGKYLGQYESQMDPGFVACVKEGLGHKTVDYQAARERKLDYCAKVHRWFGDYDLLLTPSVSVASFPADKLMPAHWPQHAWDWVSWAEFSYPFNLSGDPAASVPCGFTAEGLPVGLQIVGRRFDDLGVLQAAAAFEAAKPWADKRPKLDA